MTATSGRRPATPRRAPRPGRLLAVAAAGLTAALLTSACGGPVEAGSAAVVGDRRITVDQVQQATADIRHLPDPSAKRFSQQETLGLLVQAPYAIKVASELGIGVSEDDARQFLLSVRNPSESGLLAVQGALALQRIRSELPPEKLEEARSQATREMASAHIQVNPRYGQGVLNADGFQVAQSDPNWLDPDALRRLRSPQEQLTDEDATQGQDPNAQDPNAQDPSQQAPATPQDPNAAQPTPTP